MSKNVLFAWVGMADLRASREEERAGLGPIGQAVYSRSFSSIVLLSDHKPELEKIYCQWLKTIKDVPIRLFHLRLSGPTCFEEIYEAAVSAIKTVTKEAEGRDLSFTYHLSPGTPAMAAVWIILAKTSHPAELIESSPQAGVKTVSFPFDISADYLPSLRTRVDDEIIRLTRGLPTEAPEFNAIIHRSREMKRIVGMARRLAIHDVPVLIQGESGTGKELFARAIHATSSRSAGPFVAVNCGAIPDQLVESEFFGHVKGAFTGATRTREGYMKKADGGTLFLDEIGELPLTAQVKLLRVLQEGIVQKIGALESRKVDIRVIAATNKNLLQEVEEGRFRDDLFHRLAVGVFSLPPLRERKGDLNLLIDHILDQINKESEKITGWKHKNISVGARNLMARHTWPGNVRELFNTLSRAIIWTTGETIQEEDIRQALLPITRQQVEPDQILNRLLGKELSLPEILSNVSCHYLKRALIEAQGNKTLAAKLVGLPNYQTFSNWMKKYQVGA
ncbi:MAG: sigma 54-interacting transcriptional regulator [Candidatus Auribacterota bacterium]|nr:sigma 54-interacting transcriptional regulator [Candidatus Auribacterota bacterium]